MESIFKTKRSNCPDVLNALNGNLCAQKSIHCYTTIIHVYRYILYNVIGHLSLPLVHKPLQTMPLYIVIIHCKLDTVKTISINSLL